MANIKSAKKQARQAKVKRAVNLARKTAMKTAIKKVISALEEGAEVTKVDALLKEAEAKIARARGKRLLHANTAARKVSRLAQKVASSKKKIS